MATSKGNTGNFLIEVEDGTDGGIEQVLRKVAGLQAKADKALTSSSKSGSASYYKKEWEAAEKAEAKKLEIAKAGASAKAAAMKAAQADQISSTSKLADAEAKATNNYGAGKAAIDKVSGAFKGLQAAMGPIAIAIGAITAAVMAFDTYAGEADAARKATVSMQISIDGAREAMGGMVSDMDLARMGNKAFAMGVAQNGVAFEALAKGVNKIAMDLGDDSMQLMDSAITAIGRGSALVLDNLGIILTSEQAQLMYAQSLGKTVGQLTAYEKSQAFAYAATVKIAEAGKEAGASVDSMANSYLKAKKQMENFKNGVVGFDDNVGKVRDNIRGMSPEVLALFGSRQADDIGTINRELKRQAEIQAEQARAFGDTTAVAADYLITYEDVLAVADELGNVEKMRGGQLDYDNRIKREKELERLGKEALTQQEKMVAKADAQAKIEEKANRVANLKKQADEIDHGIALLGLQKNKEGEILSAQIQSLNLRKQAAKLEGDKASALEQQRAIELALAAPLKKKGGGSGPTEADRQQAAGEAITQQLNDQIKLFEVQGKLRGTEIKDAGELAKLRLDAADAELELERQVLEVTRTKNSVEKQNKENRLAEIDRERELISLQYIVDERAAANELIDQAVEKEQKLAQAEAVHGQQRQAEASKYAQAENQRAEQRGAMELALARGDADRKEIQSRLDDDAHLRRLAAIEQEKQAKVAAFAVTEAGLGSNDQAAKEALAHDRKMSFMDLEMQKRAEVEAQATRIAAAEAGRLLATINQINSIAGQVQGVAGQVTGIVTTELGRTRAIEDEAFAAKIQKMNDEGAATAAAFDRELEANKGNSAAIQTVKQRKANWEAANRKKIEKAEAAHNEKRKKQEMRMAGVQLLIVGAIEAGKAAAAIAGFNYVEGAAHIVASALNIGYGVALMSGRIPVGGGAGNGGGGGGGGSGNSGVGSDSGRETSDAQKTPESVPGTAANKQSSMAKSQHDSQSKSAGGVNFNGNVVINATGKVDKESAEAFGFGILKNSHSRESLSK